ncbi:MAG: LPXTG cell wall anchor domain-containing protein [Veillonella sp.]
MVITILTLYCLLLAVLVWFMKRRKKKVPQGLTSI